MMEKHIQIIAGRPSSGKTLLSSQYCRTAIIDGKSVLFFSLEQSKQRLQQLYGIPKMVEVIETPSLSWKNILAIIAIKKPNLCIVDYLQIVTDCKKTDLLKLHETIFKNNQNMSIVILSQVSKEVDCKKGMPTLGDVNMVKISPFEGLSFIGLRKLQTGMQ